MAIMNADQWRVLRPLIEAVFDLEPDQRSAWLEDLARQSPTVAAEVRTLLDRDLAAEHSGFLSVPPTVPWNASLEDTQLGAYILERPIGHGGMGTVWLGRRADGRFEGHAAVKLLHLALLTPGGQARFRREGSVLARLNHPGIARLLDAGVTPAGQPYLVLEYVHGRPINVFARELRLSDRVQLFLRVLEPVAHAHANLIVHRDLKPSNILITDDGAVKLLDFGIAKLLAADSTSGDRTGLTADAGLALTPDYASPEQVRGDPITTATDVYSLGVLLYVLIAGRHPTAAGCRTPGDVVRALYEVEPAPIGLSDLDAILAQALRKDPRVRYQTVTALADDLRRYLRHEPVRARRGSVVYLASKFVRRHRAGLTATSLTGAALIGATAFSIAQMRIARHQRDAAIFANTRANAQIEFQALLTSQLSDQPLTMRDILDRARAALERQYRTNPQFLTSVLVQLSDRYADLANAKTRGALLARAESIAIANGYFPEVAEVRCDIADNLRMEGRYDSVRPMLRSADSVLRNVHDPDVRVACLDDEAAFETEAGDPKKAVLLLRHAIAIRDSIGKTHDPKYLDLLGNLAGSLSVAGQPRQAIAMFDRTQSLMDSAGLGTTMGAVINEHNWGLALLKLGESVEAERQLHDVIDRATGSDPSGRLPEQPLIHYAYVAMLQRHFDSAQKYFTMLRNEAAQEGSAYWSGRALFGLAISELRAGRIDEGRRDAARFRALAPNASLRRTDDEIVDSRMLDAALSLASGDTVAAGQPIMDVLRAAGYDQGKRQRTFHSALITAAEAALAAHDDTAALRFARDARTVTMLDSLTNSRSAFVGEARLVEARAMLANGDTAGGRATVDVALPALRVGAGPAHERTLEAEHLAAALGGHSP